MRVAVPLFGSRVSPRFDCAQLFLIVTTEEGGNWQRQELPATDWALHERINRLVALGVDTVICGGIDRWSAESLLSVGMTIHDSITGEADEALAAVLRGEMGRGKRAEDAGVAATPRSAVADAPTMRKFGAAEVAVWCRTEEAPARRRQRRPPRHVTRPQSGGTAY